MNTLPLKADNSTHSHWARQVRTSVVSPVVVGLVVLIAFVGGFGIWAAVAPIAGAAIAPGHIAASGQNLRVQHFEGGIIEEILVQPGELVQKGQPLLTLDAKNSQSLVNRINQEIVAMQARLERLKSEIDDTDLEFGAELRKQAAAAGMESHLNEQLREFQKRRERYNTDASILDQQIAALEERIVGLESQITSSEAQIELLDEEIAIKKELVERQLTTRSDLLGLQRIRQELRGRLGGFRSSIAEAKSSIIGGRQSKARLQAERSEAAATSLNEIRRRLVDFMEQRESALDVLNRVVVRAPSDGVIVEIAKNTPGSVVKAGEDLFVLLPAGSELIVQARLLPQDIDLVQVGQPATLRFSALNQRTTPEIQGKVIYVSADRLVDPATNEPFYTARLQIADELPDGVTQAQIFPGMPVETYINTGTRTFFEYLGKPLIDSFSRAFREE